MQHRLVPPSPGSATLSDWRKSATDCMGEESKAPVSSFLLDFGRALKAERERQGLSLSDISERCGVEKGAISRLENGLNTNPTVDTIRRCAQALGKAITLGLADEEGSDGCPGPGRTRIC